MDSYDDFERRLLGLELRRPPAEWKRLLLPTPIPPLFPKPWRAGLIACWSASIGFIIATPESEDLGPPVLPPSPQVLQWDHPLAYQTDRMR